MFASRMMIQRCVPSMARRAAFSTESAPAQKLREVLTQYRQEKYVFCVVIDFDTLVLVVCQ